MERVTGIEPALSAWESDTNAPCADDCWPTNLCVSLSVTLESAVKVGARAMSREGSRVRRYVLWGGGVRPLPRSDRWTFVAPKTIHPLMPRVVRGHAPMSERCE
jgi:hypothetical protein